MIQMLRRAQAQVQNALQGKVRIFINEDGKITTRDHDGNTNVMGANPLLLAQPNIPRRAQVTPQGLTFFNTFNGSSINFTEFSIRRTLGNPTNDAALTTDFNFNNLFEFFSALQNEWVLRCPAPSLMNSIILNILTSFSEIYLGETTMPNFVQGDVGDSRNMYTLIINLFKTHALYFDPTLKGILPIPTEICSFFQMSKSKIEIDFPNEFDIIKNGFLSTPHRRLVLAQFLMQYAYLLEALQDSTDFLDAVPVTETDLETRSSSWLFAIFNSYVLTF